MIIKELLTGKFNDLFIIVFYISLLMHHSNEHLINQFTIVLINNQHR